MDNIRKLVIEALADPTYNKEKLENLKDVIGKAIKNVELADDPDDQSAQILILTRVYNTIEQRNIINSLIDAGKGTAVEDYSSEMTKHLFNSIAGYGSYNVNTFINDVKNDTLINFENLLKPGGPHSLSKAFIGTSGKGYSNIGIRAFRELSTFGKDKSQAGAGEYIFQFLSKKITKGGTGDLNIAGYGLVELKLNSGDGGGRLGDRTEATQNGQMAIIKKFNNMAVSTPGFQKYGGAQFQPKLGKGGTLALTSWIGQINKALDETDPENGKTNAKFKFDLTKALIEKALGQGYNKNIDQILQAMLVNGLSKTDVRELIKPYAVEQFKAYQARENWKGLLYVDIGQSLYFYFDNADKFAQSVNLFYTTSPGIIPSGTGNREVFFQMTARKNLPLNESITSANVASVPMQLGKMMKRPSLFGYVKSIKNSTKKSKRRKKMAENLKEGVLDHSDEDGWMAKEQLYKAAKYSAELHEMISDTENLEPWIQAKITKASDYLGAVKHYMEYERINPHGSEGVEEEAKPKTNKKDVEEIKENIFNIATEQYSQTV